jgi:transposase
MTATLGDSSKIGVAIYMSFELALREWKLGFASSPGKIRLRCIGAGDLESLAKEIASAKKKLGLPDDAPVYSCYEAGRDGFWLHRWLGEQGIVNVVVDSASIEVDRRFRRRKTDRLDATKLVAMLIRHRGGEKVWSVVRVPSPQDEDRRQLHRDLEEMKAERTQHVNRIKGLLHSVGVHHVEVGPKFAERLVELRTAAGQEVPAEMRQRLLRELERYQFVHRQILELEGQQRQRVRRGDGQNQREREIGQGPAGQGPLEKIRKLLGLRAIGLASAWVFVMELFAWRKVKNRRELAGLVGLTPTPYSTGESAREQGISKAGNRRLRAMLIEIAWCWLRYQEKSALSAWYRQRFAKGSKRHRKIGIVALARKLLIALWKYLEHGEVPAGAQLVGWQAKLNGETAAA